MRNDVIVAFEDLKRAHRTASDSLEKSKAGADEIRKELIDKGSVPFTQLDEKMRVAFAQSLLSNPLLTEISEEKVSRALDRNHFGFLVPIHPAELLEYVRHARRRGFDLAMKASQDSAAA